MKHVLIIEDDQDIREAILDLLTSEGYVVSAAANGEEGLRLLRTVDRPDLILLDLMMPVKDGFQFRAEQLQEPDVADVPVVVMSADGHVNRKLNLIGGAAYLKKPVDVETLLNTIEVNCA